MKISFTKPLTYLAVLSGVFYGIPCHANEQEYDIEIVFFEDTSNQYYNSEKWPNIEYSLLADGTLANTNEPVKNKSNPDIKEIIDTEENKANSLERYVTRLEKSTRYNVITHKAWRQTGLDAESAIDVYIDSRENAVHLKNKPGSTTSLSKPDSSKRGNVKVILGRYLHVYTDMIYQKPFTFYNQNETAVSNIRFKEFSIKSHRRMRSNELHYIDHPLVGILVMVQPVEPPEPDENVDADKEIKQTPVAGS